MARFPTSPAIRALSAVFAALAVAICIVACAFVVAVALSFFFY